MSSRTRDASSRASLQFKFLETGRLVGLSDMTQGPLKFSSNAYSSLTYFFLSINFSNEQNKQTGAARTRTNITNEPKGRTMQ